MFNGYNILYTVQDSGIKIVVNHVQEKSGQTGKNRDSCLSLSAFKLMLKR